MWLKWLDVVRSGWMLFDMVGSGWMLFGYFWTLLEVV